MIVAAVKEGGGADPVTNAQLARVLSMAKDMSVPKDLVDRNIKRATDSKQADFMELTYEAYGHGGVGIVMEVLTDNVNRAAAEARATVNKAGGKWADSGSVLFNFERRGVVVVAAAADEEEKVFEIAMEAGAEDVASRKNLENGDDDDEEAEEEEEEGFVVTISVPDFVPCQRALADAGYAIDPDRTALKLIPLVTMKVDEETAEANEALVERLLELDDIDAVYTQ